MQEMQIQADEGKEARRIEQLRANFSVQQERIQQLRSARIMRASILASGVNAGAGTSTSASSARDSAYTGAVANVGKLNVVQGFSESISVQNEKIADSQTRAAYLEGKLQANQAKAELIGGAINLGISAATLPFGGGAGAVAGIGGFTQSIFTKKQ